MLKPGDRAPALDITLLGGGRWSLATQCPPTMTLIAFYRGAFCGFCRDFLADLGRLEPAFAKRGISTIAISTDTLADAGRIEVGSLTVGYGLQVDTIRAFGLFMSKVEREGISLEYAEPALFLVTPDAHVYAIIQNSLSCGRPDLHALLRGIDMLDERGFPLRGGD